ncbi:DNase I-like protein [Mytilinidion resinicola]|uniref:DNA-(apurinic or apyrimidinic site) endonuclease 2 n=1 Tax=Mytilinidion resinicola TaxID=574789 RepID=A0A6A6Y7G7_9PEZI|nr:DNase I-like protein [Mytilinidion resinicola]KAF2804488.1 DNase I-like protein [Mytilinidion resinicola]
MALRITTWNVNGIRNPFSYKPWSDTRTFSAMFDILEADIVIMQELKIQRKDLRDDMVLVPGWDCYFSLPKHKKGYSGVGIYTRQSMCAPIRAEEGLLGSLCPPASDTPYRDLPEDSCIGAYPSDFQIAELGVDPASLDAEGRCVVLEFPAFVLFGIYSPANSNGERDDYRHAFVCAMDIRVRNLEKLGKRVVLTGDLNISREGIDTAKVEEQMRKEGMTWEDYFESPNRKIFNQLLEGGKVMGEREEGREKPVLWDVCRGFHQGREGMYTHWEQKINARPGNFGSRIDYVLCSIEMKTWIEDSNIQEGLMGSDHCPVYATLKPKVDLRGKEIDLRDIMNPPGMFQDGKRLREWSTKDLTAFSGRLLPEFSNRRNIRDMFARKPSVATSKSNAERPTASSSIVINEEMNETQESEHPSEETSQEDSTRQSLPPPSTGESTTSSVSLSSNKRSSSNPQSAKPLKKLKSSGATSKSPAPSKGQQSLRGFFKPKEGSSTSQGTNTPIPEIPSSTQALASPPNTTTISESEQAIEGLTAVIISDDAPSPPKTSTPKSSRVKSQGKQSPTTSTPNGSPSLSILSPSARSDRSESIFVDPIVSKESWSKLFTKKPNPRCEGHDEPCKTMQTKKPGPNCGRSFWICSRPIGPSGAKEVGTEWRCGTFIWASDWKSPGS